MEHRALGRTGIRVSDLCLGTMMFGAWGNADESACRRMVDMSLDAGINFIDTADEYADGESEQIVGQALRGRRDSMVLATKFFNPMGADPNQRGSSRRWIVRAVEDSLRRLQTDYIDLYQAHRPDPDTEVEETLRALDDLVRAGKVRAIGSSSFPAEQLVEAQWAARRINTSRFQTEQLSYSIFARQAEAAALPTAERYGMGVMVWAPLNGGWLTGKYRAGHEPASDSRAARHPDHFAGGTRRKAGLVGELEVVAADVGCSLIELALRFVLSHRAVTSALVGPRTPEQLASQLSASGRRLDDATLDRIDELVAPGTNLNPSDAGWTPPALVEPLRRRRPGAASPGAS